MGIRLNILTSYKYLAIVFFLQAIFLTVVRGVLLQEVGEDYLFYLGPMVLPLGILFFLLILNLIHRLKVSKLIFRSILLLFFSSIILRLTSVLLDVSPENRLLLSFISTGTLFAMQSLCVYFMSINLFLEENPVIEKLWASVCVYFMIGACFGTLYSFLILLDPTALGGYINSPLDSYIIGIVYSINVISGMDVVFQEASETMKLTAVLESVFTTLFLVILIGRLLGYSEKSE